MYVHQHSLQSINYPQVISARVWAPTASRRSQQWVKFKKLQTFQTKSKPSAMENLEFYIEGCKDSNLMGEI